MSDSEKIQGVWRADTEEHGGLVMPISRTMFGSKLLYRLNPDKQPKEIDLEHRRPRERPRKSAQGIYLLAGDTLTVCWGYHGARPAEFVANHQSDQHLLVLKRID